MPALFPASPIKTDGTKKPLGKWKIWQERIATPAEIDQLFINGVGVAIVNGAVSGNKELIDLDVPDLSKMRWCASCRRDCSSGCPRWQRRGTITAADNITIELPRLSAAIPSLRDERAAAAIQ